MNKKEIIIIFGGVTIVSFLIGLLIVFFINSFDNDIDYVKIKTGMSNHEFICKRFSKQMFPEGLNVTTDTGKFFECPVEMLR